MNTYMCVYVYVCIFVCVSVFTTYVGVCVSMQVVQGQLKKFGSRRMRPENAFFDQNGRGNNWAMGECLTAWNVTVLVYHEGVHFRVRIPVQEHMWTRVCTVSCVNFPARI